MKKVLFLMFLLFLIGLGTVNVKAQVRIGGNTAPSAAAVLDLNATDAANTGRGGLVLPKVDLKTNTMPLTTGVANLTGTLVYDVTATLGQIGIYYWNGNAWVKSSLPSTSAADSGKFLMSNGNSIVLSPLTYIATNPLALDTARLNRNTAVGLTLIVDTLLQFPFAVNPRQYFQITLPGLYQTDLCFAWQAEGGLFFTSGNGFLNGVSTHWSSLPKGYNLPVRCFRPSA